MFELLNFLNNNSLHWSEAKLYVDLLSNKNRKIQKDKNSKKKIYHEAHDFTI